MLRPEVNCDIHPPQVMHTRLVSLPIFWRIPMNIKILCLAAAAMVLTSTANAAPNETPATAKNVVLVHGGFVDGSGWQKVYSILKKDGYNVSIVQNPTTSLADDVAFT